MTPQEGDERPVRPADRAQPGDRPVDAPTAAIPAATSAATPAPADYPVAAASPYPPPYLTPYATQPYSPSTPPRYPPYPPAAAPGYPSSAPPGYPPHPGYPPPYPPAPGSSLPPPGWSPAPPAAGWPLPVSPRRSTLRRVLLLCAALTVLCGTPAVWAVARYAQTLMPALVGSDVPEATPTGSRSPRPGDPPAVRAAWMRAQISSALDAQGAALLRGDEDGFLAIGEAGNTEVRKELARRYRSLRALQVTVWDPEVSTTPTPPSGGADQWRARLSLRHCFVVSTCEPEELRVESRWVDRDGRAYLVELAPSGADQNGPRPWEVADLRAAVGKRAVVATTADYASRLSGLLSEADRAAGVADRYTVGPAPDRYRLFFAGNAEWRRWYNGNRPEWAAGYAVPTSNRRIDVMLNAAEVPSGFLDDIMRHELSHAASLRGARHQSGNLWWLVEGLAEQAELYGRPASEHDAVAAGAVRRFIGSGKWDGTVAVTEPGASAELQEAGARYGIAFLAVRRLMERYGEAKTMAFFKAVVHDGKSAETAAPDALGAQWTDVQADCVSYVRRTAS